MSIIRRFRDVMASNFNALLDKAENPEKMLDQCLRDLRSDYGKVKAETAAIMAEEQRAKRVLDECIEEMEKLQRFAIKALEQNNESDARKFLERRSQLSLKEADLKSSYELAVSNSQKMREMHSKLQEDIKDLESRKVMLKGKLSAAKAQERMNNMSSPMDGSSRSTFDRMEEKVNKALDTANAMAELNTPKDEIGDLMAKYSEGSSTDPSIDDELEALKKSLKDK
ncbi:phage shock protein A [Anaerobacillus arseniciselenatis]|uniref:Phage shock protein A n=1 Tax=Anaerobacillus arseniciselenatis TaxID=85682 RepID=A0A1S2LRL7_9BACI|nr:PspA/IM30 family protein [Anaerobacillus arseniciselenatis]OIJ15152.1 phage shock protein A [Anaerobacillus arseniciselenatis]